MAGASASVVQWAPIAQQASAQYGVPASLLLAQINQESGGIPVHTTGSTPGLGNLTQFLPGTAKSYGVQFGTSPQAVRSQIFGQAKFLSDLGVHQNPGLALAKYNAGPGNPQAGMGYARSVLAQQDAYRAYDRGPAPSGGTAGIRPTAVPRTVPGVQNPQTQAKPVAHTVTQANPGVQELETLLGGSGLGSIGSLLSGALNSTQEHTQFITPQHSQTLDAQRSLQELAGPVQINLHPASGAGTVGTGGNKIAAMTKMANALVGKPYIWGGGHSAWGPQGGYDCSGFVSAVLHAAGYLRAPQTTQTLPSQPDIASGPGRYVTVYDRTDGGTPSNDHVIIDVNGAWYESGGSNNPSRNGGVARIPKPDPSYLSSFNRQLHPLGL